MHRLPTPRRAPSIGAVLAVLALTCPAWAATGPDLSGDGVIDSTDLNIVLASFGTGPGGDVNGDGKTNSADLNLVLAAFGQSVSGGACCLGGLDCFIETAEECGFLGGTYMGDGSGCGSVNCDDFIGACCLDDGPCIEDITLEGCDFAGGQWIGGGSTCDDALLSCTLGACCLPDDSCDDDGLALGVDCVMAGGEFVPSQACFQINCALTGEGACCLASQGCFIEEGLECGFLGGVYFGAGSTCEGVECADALGACCIAHTECFEGVSEDVCNLNAGDWGGPGSDCAFICEFGACCLPDGTCDDLDLFLGFACADAGGVFFPGEDCASLDCPD